MPSAAATRDFYKDLEDIETLTAAPVLDATALARNLAAIYDRCVNAEFGSYDVAAIAKAAPEIMYRLFDLRMLLRGRMPEFAARGFMTAEVVQRLRDVYRILRYVSDMVGEIAIGNARSTNDKAMPGFTGKDHNTLVNWKFYHPGDQALAFRSGDVLLVRGQAHNSAAIARIGDVDSQFSHTGVVYIDAQGKHWLVESLIEDGAVITPLKDALAHGIVRAALYRHHDAHLAAGSAKAIHDHVMKHQGWFKRPIRYDFSMRPDGGRNLFCSKLVRLAYSMGSGGFYKLPAYKTHISATNRDFLDRIGVKANETYAPGDIDLEPEFDLVCEWQDYRETSHIRLQDLTMDKLFEWMEAYGYRFKETTLVKFVALFGRFSSTWVKGAKDFMSSVIPKVPINMPRKTIATVAMLHQTAEPIYRELQKHDAAMVAEAGRPMHGKEVYELLEQIRARDGAEIGYLARD